MPCGLWGGVLRLENRYDAYGRLQTQSEYRTSPATVTFYLYGSGGLVGFVTGGERYTYVRNLQTDIVAILNRPETAGAVGILYFLVTNPATIPVVGKLLAAAFS